MNSFSRKRRYKDELDDFEHLFGGRSNDNDDDNATVVSHAAIEIVNCNRPNKHPGLPNKHRNDSKMFWSNGYLNWTDEEFIERLCLHRESFEYILTSIRPMIHKEATNMVPDATVIDV